eukprot:gnl/Spiro4/6458_TR3313_c0_g1_i1.p1 gnl/Spiro4/6458_TR3313_c0_g1~~gnl/Spiro4/6458_TR3313_c0_g1_i1.p1  ORF type:complete len:759 (-),score=179.88 gnl/Spiro4/6458_TR3313_c0_g1_i1:82-2358(-)
MSSLLLFLFLFSLLCSVLPVCADADADWLISRVTTHASVARSTSTLTLSNGLVSRVFTLMPAFGTIDFILNATTERFGAQSMFRSVKPEATVELDGLQYVVGGLNQSSTFLAYCNRTELNLTVSTNAFVYTGYAVSEPEAPFRWKPGSRGSPTDLSWPPKGVHLQVNFAAPDSAPPAHKDVVIEVHYELYDGVPLLSKWLKIYPKTSRGAASSSSSVVVSACTVELFGANAHFGPYTYNHGAYIPGTFYNGAAFDGAPPALLFAHTDAAHGAACNWQDDYPNSADPDGLVDQGASEPFLNCSYLLGPGARASLLQPFVSFRVLELVHDDTDLQRQALARQRAVQTLVPHVTENPIFFHATNISDAGFKLAIDQMADVGFEMLIYSFGTDFDLETANQTYLNIIRDQVAYAHSKGIEVGGYDLICLARGHDGYGGNVGDEWDAVALDGNLTSNACFASGWYDKLNSLVENFVQYTGLSMLETDGPYGGESCASTNHSHHTGYDDSVYEQMQRQSSFFMQLRNLGMYVNQPDTFFYQGGSKTAMGYDENQYSLSRWHDLSISRMGMYDDLYMYLPTQGWMFVPLDDYHGGGDNASFAPVSQHLVEYEWALAQYMGAGVAACYRGEKLYDSPAARDVVAKWVRFYKKHRSTLIQPVVHMRRATMQSWDGWLHVNPRGTDIVVALLFNPTDSELTSASVSLPLYYAGAENFSFVFVSVDEGEPQARPVDRGSRVTVSLTMPPRSVHTVVVTPKRDHQDSFEL